MKQISMPNARNRQEHPHYFGTYLNMARHNAYMILSYLSEKYNDNKPIDEAKLHQAGVLNLLVNSKKPDETYKLIGDLRHHFPFLCYKDVLHERDKATVKKADLLRLADKLNSGKDKKKEVKPDELQPKEYADLLKSLFETLNKLRNSFSHFKSSFHVNFDKEETFFTIYDAALYRLIDKNKQTKRYDYFTHEHIAPLERSKPNIKAQSVPYKITAKEIDDKALMYFICLFLEPKYASIFLSRLAGFQKALTEDKMSLTEKAPLKAYTMFCCRLPQPKLESSDIMLDMLNELNRCPKELYPVLSEANRDRRFKIVINADDLKAAEDNGITADMDEYTEGVAQEVVLLRHNDRFPYFALRYFDDTNAFPRLRFHVQLGKVLKKNKYGKVMYGETRERELTQPIFTFSTLKPMRDRYDMVNQDKLEEKIVDERYINSIKPNWIIDDDGKVKVKDYLGKYDTSWIEEVNGKTQLKSIIEQFSPHYNFGEQTIGFKIFNNEADLNIYDNYLPGLPNFEKQDKIKGTEPDAFFSTYELRNLFFYQYLYKEGTIQTSAEDFILDYIKNIKQFFKDVADGTFKPLTAPPDFTKNEQKPYHKDKWERKILLKEYDERQIDMEERRKLLTARIKETYNIGKTSIPQDIWEYLLAYKIPPYGEYVTKKLIVQHKEIKQRLKAINILIDEKGKEKPKDPKEGDKDRAPRTGEQATWLAEDILHFMPPRKHIVNAKEHDQKMNNDQFRILQYSLAYFSSNKDDIWHYFKEMGLIHNPVTDLQHPFLQNIGKGECKSLLDFYKKYLVAKDNFLGEVVKFVCGDIDNPQYANPDVIKAKYGYFLPKPEKKGMSKSYEGVPILLPKGLFNEAISMSLNKTKKAGYKGEINTVVYSLEQYVNGDTQDFFGYDHYYQMPKVEENTEGSNHKDVDEKRAVKLKSAYVAELEADILKLDEQKEVIGRGKPKNNKQEEIRKEKLQEMRDKLRDTHRIKNRILDREQTIRYHQTNDRALWLMIKDRQNNASEHMDIDLKGVELANLEEVLSKLVTVKGEIPNSQARIIEQLPIRRYGDLRRVLKDRRLANLALYYQPVKEIEHEKIKKEFELYDLGRESFFAEIYNFERNVYTWFKDEFDPDVVRRGGFYEHNIFMDIATHHLTDRTKAEHYNNNVKNLRNRFLHNQIPYFDWLTDEVQNESHDYMCEKIFVVAKRYYTDLLKMIKPKRMEASTV